MVKYGFLSLMVCLSGMGLRAYAAPALPIELRYKISAHPELQLALRRGIETPLYLASLLAPPNLKNHLFDWKIDKDILRDKRVYFEFVDREEAAELSLNLPVSEMATTVIDHLHEGMDLKVYLFVDRIFFDARGCPRRDGSTRLAVTLASQIFGPVQKLLHTEEPLRQTPRLQAELQLAAHKAAVRCLRRAIGDGRMQSFIHNSFVSLLEPTKQAQEFWQNQVDQCEQLFDQSAPTVSIF